MFNEVTDETIWDEQNGIPIIGEKPLAFREKRAHLCSGIVNYKHLKLGTDAFNDNGIVPCRYTCDGRNINPPIDINHLPVNAKTLAIIVDDPDGMNGSFVIG
jgi:phosphatidylethanolamine-binding protein (PEBP) family uncharacterized protein